VSKQEQHFLDLALMQRQSKRSLTLSILGRAKRSHVYLLGPTPANSVSTLPVKALSVNA